MGRVFQFCNMKRLLDIGCTPLRMYLTPLNCISKHGQKLFYVYLTTMKIVYGMLILLLEMSHVQQKNGWNCEALSSPFSKHLLTGKPQTKHTNAFTASPFLKLEVQQYLILISLRGWGQEKVFREKKKCPIHYRVHLMPLPELRW